MFNTNKKINKTEQKLVMQVSDTTTIKRIEYQVAMAMNISCQREYYSLVVL